MFWETFVMLHPDLAAAILKLKIKQFDLFVLLLVISFLGVEAQN